MARRTYKQNNPGTEDSEQITSAFTSAYSEYVAEQGPISVSELLMSFDGSKSELARALAEATGTKYESQMKNITRWLNYENGVRGPQARNPANSVTSSRFTDLYMSRNPPSGMSISITGWIGYDGGDFRHRTVNIDSSLFPMNVAAFVADMRAGDTHGAYREAFAGYANLIVAEAEHVSINFS